MKRLLAAALLTLTLLTHAAAQTGNEQAVRDLIVEGSLQFKQGNFVEAQRLFERARVLDPEFKVIYFFIARAIRQQYKPGVDTPENRAKAEEAIDAYKRVMAQSNLDQYFKEDAFNAVAFLYRQMKDEKGEEAWLLTLAEDPDARGARRADAYTVLASKRWDCSYNITESSKLSVGKGDNAVLQYKKKSQEEFDRAQNCAREGLDLIERALILNPSSAAAWAYKTNILREMARLAEMEMNDAAKMSYERQAAAAEAEHNRLRREESKIVIQGQGVETGPVGPIGPAPQPPDTLTSTNVAGPSPTSATGRKMTISGGVLNGKAVYKVAPAYPAEAKAEKVSGAVNVQLTIDEEGKVISAVPISGHPLLQAAAAEAARQWRFTPTTLAGQPVKVTGVVIFNFSLN